MYQFCSALLCREGQARIEPQQKLQLRHRGSVRVIKRWITELRMMMMMKV